MKKLLSPFMILCLLALLVVPVVACAPAEDGGDEGAMEESMDQMGDEMEEAGDEMAGEAEEAMDEAGDAMDDAMDEAGDAMDDAGDAMDDAMDDSMDDEGGDDDAM